MEHFTPWASLAGGLLIGLSTALLLLFNGRIAGISGILAGIAFPTDGGRGWRAAFIAGLVAGGVAMVAMRPELFAITTTPSLPMLAVAGAVVGVGVRIGGGCTSGHGVCGNSRLSKRSLVATLTFIATGALTVAAVRILGSA